MHLKQQRTKERLRKETIARYMARHSMLIKEEREVSYNKLKKTETGHHK